MKLRGGFLQQNLKSWSPTPHRLPPAMDYAFQHQQKSNKVTACTVAPSSASNRTNRQWKRFRCTCETRENKKLARCLQVLPQVIARGKGPSVTADNLLIGWTGVKVIPLSFKSPQREHKQTNGQLRTFSAIANSSTALLDLDTGISGRE